MAKIFSLIFVLGLVNSVTIKKPFKLDGVSIDFDADADIPDPINFAQ